MRVLSYDPSHGENRLVEFWTVLSDKARYLFVSVCCKGGVLLNFIRELVS